MWRIQAGRVKKFAKFMRKRNILMKILGNLVTSSTMEKGLKLVRCSVQLIGIYPRFWGPKKTFFSSKLFHLIIRDKIS